MATWNEVQAHMRRSYRLHHDEPNVLAMTWAYTDGRTQRIIVRRYEAGEVEMLELKSPFAEYGAPDPVELLRENCRLPVGAVGLSSDTYILVHNAALEGLSLASLDDLLARVARHADKLEARYGVKDTY